MPEIETEILTPKAAARRIFDTPQPSDQQIGTVLQWMKSGQLKRTDEHSWTTSSLAVAEYLAKQDRQKSHGSSREKQENTRHRELFSTFYNGILQEYFLAVIMQRGLQQHSATFQRLVVATQALLLCAGVSILLYTSWLILQNPFVPPEHRVIQAWLNEKYHKVEVLSIEPTATQPAAHIVRFKYQESGRQIQSKLKLSANKNQVTILDSED